MNRSPVLVHYWAGCPESPNARWTRTLHEIRACAQQGWKTYLVWSRRPDDASLWRPFTDCGCEIVIHARPERSFDAACIWRTYRWLRSLKCDVFHCHNQHTSPLIGATLAGVPVRLWSKLAMSQQYEHGGPTERRSALMPSVRVSCLLAHRVLAVSEAVSEELLQLGIPRSKVTVSPGAIDLQAYATDAADGIMRDFGFHSGHKVVTTVGHAIPVKGWDILLRAFGVVTETAPNARLLLVGGIDGAEEAETFQALSTLAKELRVADRVCFAGRRSDIGRVLCASDIFVLPSRSEGHPNALKEAMAAGLPCIGSRVGGIPELLQDEVGLMFARGDHLSLARLLRTLLDDEGLQQRLGEKGRQAVRVFDLEPATRRTLALYEMLLGQTKDASKPARLMPSIVRRKDESSGL